jgi:CheY-like chemotaxis protein
MVLFIDDNESFRSTFKDVLATLGRQCDTAAGRTEAEELLNQRRSYGIVFVDIDLSGGVGPPYLQFELICRSIKRKMPDIPIVAVSGEKIDPDYMFALQQDHGVKGFLNKRKLSLEHVTTILEKLNGPATSDVARSDLVLLQQKIASAVVRLRIREGADGWEGGTAFMVSEHLALTARHNVPETMLGGHHTTMRAVHFDTVARPLVFALVAGYKQHDIAVLRLVDNPDRVFLGALQVAALPAAVSRLDAVRYWQGHKIARYGFPFNGAGQGDRWIVGMLHSGQPIEKIDLGSIHYGTEGGRTWRFRCLADNAHALQGISGGPMVDVDSGMVVGVQHSYEPADGDVSYVYGTPLCRLLSDWPGLITECGAVVLQPM